jgi:hypothetical protein
MKRKIVAAAALMLLTGISSAAVLESFGTVSGSADVKPALKVTEVLADSSSATGEKVEVYNPSDASVNLTEFKVSDGFDRNRTLAGLNGTSIDSNEYAVIVESDYSGSYQNDVSYFSVASGIGNGLADNDGKINIWSDDETRIDSFSYLDCEEGESTKRLNLEGTDKECGSTAFGTGDLQ